MGLVREYDRNAEQAPPLGAYAAMMLVFVGAFASLLVRASRNGHLPRRLSSRDIILLGAATQRLTRILTRDKVTSTLRAPFTELEGTAGAGEVREHAPR